MAAFAFPFGGIALPPGTTLADIPPAAGIVLPAGAAPHVPAADSSWIAELTFKVHEPTLVHETSEGKRLIKKVTAYRDGVEFWTQVFYRSTGMNSKYPNVWFPFLGLSKYDKKPSYYSKDIRPPMTWPGEDILKTKGPEFGLFREASIDLAGRFVTRSFLLGSNAISALHEEKDERAYILSILFAWELHPEKVDETIKHILTANTHYNDFKEEYSLKPSSDKEINAFIGKDIYINYGKEKKLNLSALNDLPDYTSLLLMGGRRARKQTRRRRVAAQRRTRHKGHGRR